MGILKAFTSAASRAAVNSYENNQKKKNSKKAYELTGKQLSGKHVSKQAYKNTYRKNKAALDKKTEQNASVVHTFIDKI